MVSGFDCESICTVIDAGIYKRVVHEMLVGAGVFVAVKSRSTRE